MRFGKNVISQNLRTQCDLALYLTLFTPGELQERTLPAPLDARPGVGSLRDAGVEQETLIYNRLHQAFGDRCIGAAPRRGQGTRWGDQPLAAQLYAVAEVPAVLIQSRFDIGNGRDAMLQRLGTAAADLQPIPRFEAFIPDVILVEEGAAHRYELKPTGERVPLAAGEQRLGLSLVDVKHAQDANPSYEAEVALYGVLLANWILDQGYSDRFFVSSQLFLWTRGGVAQGALQEALDQNERDPAVLMEAVRIELDPVNVPIYVQALRRFFGERLPSVIRTGNADWTSLEWHVGPACASCDWLGFEGWLSPRDRIAVTAHPERYCFSRATSVDHISRLPLVTRGSRRVLEASGFTSVAQLAQTNGTEVVYSRHTTLKADRRSIPGYATAIANGAVATDANRADGMLSRYADLDVFLSVNFDPGAGLLTAIGLHAYFRQPYPLGQAPAERQSRRWRERYIVTAKTPDAEQSALLAFLRQLAAIFEFVTDTDPLRGGPHAATTRCQMVFWDARQFEELCLALGRHLHVILYDREPRLVRALTWLFPPEEVQENDAIDERRPMVAFVRDTVRRLVRVPALHALTLFNAAQHYYHGDNPFRPPDNFYREPLSDTIPRERIYEIWSLAAAGAGGTVRWGGIVKTYNQLLEGFSRAIDAQGFALSSVAWRLRSDFGARLKAEAPTLRLVVPTWAQGVAHDSKLWIAWAKFESALSRALSHLQFMADPEEAEASHEAVRLIREVRHLPTGSIEYELSPESLNTKLRAPDGYLCISVDAVPGFLALPAWAVIPYADIPQHLRWLSKTPMHALFGVRLESLDRVNRLATLTLGDFYGYGAQERRELRGEVIAHLGTDFQRHLTLLPALPNDVKVQRLVTILTAVGNPRNAVAAPETLRALGVANRQATAGRDAVTPLSRVLWEATALHDTVVRPPNAVADVVDAARRCVQLNPSQEAAIRDAAARRISVVWGPPGTGKTNTCAGLLHGLVVHEARLPRQKPYAILVTGPTYKAVGELVARLGRSLAADPNARCRLFSVYAEHRTDRFPLPDNPPGHLQVTEAPANHAEQSFNDLADNLTQGGHVVVVAAVTHQCARMAQQLGRLRGVREQVLWPLFDFVLVDETSQVDMTTGVGPLALLKDDFQLTVAGDHLQMPPVVPCDPPVGAEHLVGSLQTYLTNRFQIRSVPLLENYRSNEQIVAYTRRLGYPPELHAAHPETSIVVMNDFVRLGTRMQDAGLLWSELWAEVLEPARPLVAITYDDGMAGQANSFEAECVASLVWLLRHSMSQRLNGRGDNSTDIVFDDEGFWSRGIGIVTPHRAQRAQVLQALQRTFPNTALELIEDAVDTVERFQGGQRQVIVISFGVGDPDVIRGEERFLMQLERTNVAISRAMAKCIVLLSEEVANHIPNDRKAAAAAHALRGVVDEWCVNKQSAALTDAEGRVRRVTARWR